MERLQLRNDHHAFGQLLERWEQPIVRLCARMTGDGGRAEELKQETFARVFARRADFQRGMRFSTWLWRIALNLCCDEHRRSQRRTARLHDVVQTSEDWLEGSTQRATPAQLVTRSEESELLRTALLQLPETVRSIVVLRVCETLTLREVAEIVALPESTVRCRLAEGLNQLTRLLEAKIDRAARQSSAPSVAPVSHPTNDISNELHETSEP